MRKTLVAVIAVTFVVLVGLAVTNLASPAVPTGTPVTLRTPAPAVTEVIQQTIPPWRRSILLTGTPDPAEFTPQPDEAHKVRPTRPAQALSPIQVAKLPPPPGTPAACLKLPIEYGRFRILPSGGVPQPCMGPPPPKPGLKAIRTDIEGGATKEECRKFDLFVDVEHLPAGWQFEGCSATMLVWDDGETTNIICVASYRQPDYPAIGIGQVLLAPGEVVDIVADDGTDFALTLSEVRGVPVAITHPAPGVVIEGGMEIEFVIGDRLVHIGGTGIEVQQLIRVAEAFIAQIQKGGSKL